ncbi:HNH endonuclease signature motif containing protein [uncultured Nocardioides sp.]|uniref:HNH endonuclease signature motif containing protein n=1 Tax=uncultured Nocardioides sp. TaxID=198441 RepID=UPI002636867E|nr:HNH endonuclease signature motif containing protein [uncultured Nocardioides sp.]
MTHPIITAASDIRSSLKAVADANPIFMTVEEKATALQDLVAAEGQLAELRLRILADAGDLAAETAAQDAAGWLAHHTRTRYADARAELRLAAALDRDRPRLVAAMREGSATLAQVQVIDRALNALPPTLPPQTVADAEEHLVERAREFGPKELGRIGRRILDVVAPEIAEAAEGARLAELEARARDVTRLTMRRLGDGTTRISSVVPDAAATRFATYLEAHANPRRAHAGATTGKDDSPGDVTATAHDPVARLAYPRRMGEAFVAFLETVDASQLPIHGGSATTVVVTIPLAALQAELAGAGIVGAGLVPGDDLAGDRISASQARRLACTANIVPAVLGGRSVPLDLGRSRRLFTPTQRLAMAVRDQTCRADGCDVPANWCEAHHLRPWEHGGRTDIDDGALLCSHHHHRVHDAGYLVERLPHGELRFHRRR